MKPIVICNYVLQITNSG